MRGYVSTLPKIFNEAIRQPAKTKKSKRPPAFKPSMLGSPCLRKVYYSYNKVPEEKAFPIGAQRIMELGNYVGDMLYAAFKKAGIAIDYVDENGKIPIRFGKPCPEFPISSEELEIPNGLIDLTCIIEKQLWLGEFKSINSNGYSNLQGPKPAHLVQGIIYLYIFNKMLREGAYKHIKQLDDFDRATGIRFLYYNKDSSNLKEFTLTTADELFKQIVMKIETIKMHSKNDTLPEKTPDYCNSCPWAQRCSKNLKK